MPATFGTPLTVLRVVELVADVGGRGEVHEALRVEAEENLARANKDLEARNLRVNRVVEAGPPADVILDRPRRDGAGLIAKATRVCRDPAVPPFGSVAARVMGHGTVPLLFWRSGIPRARR